MAKPVFEPPPDAARQDSLTQVASGRSDDLSEFSPDGDVKGEVQAEADVQGVHPVNPAGGRDVFDKDDSLDTVRVDMSAAISVEVCYATPDEQTVIALSVIAPCTVKEAVRASGILARHPEIDLSVQSVGIFGKIKQLDDFILADDRIEIYRPLIVDPKVARERRVAKARKGGSSEGRKWATRARRSL